MGDHSLPSEMGVIERLTKLEPAVIRSTLVGATAIAAGVTGKVIDPGWIEDTLFIYTMVSPIVAGLVVRRAVTPVARVQEIIDRMRSGAKGA